MIISLCGKGGCGKSTVSALLAKEFAKRGNSVLVLDADESNSGLNRQLGLSMPRDFINFFGGKSAISHTIKNSELEPSFMEQTWAFSDIPTDYISEKHGIKLLTVGKIRESGEGCACPAAIITKRIIANLRLNTGDVLIMDTEAGIEHLGRGIEIGVDALIVVVEPSFESIELSKTISKKSREIHKPTYFVLNKVDSLSEDYMRNNISNDCNIIAAIPTSSDIAHAGLLGEALDFENDQIKKLVSFLKEAIS